MVGRFPRPLPRIAAAPKPPAVEPAPAPTAAAESVEFDEEDRRLITVPIAAPARPVPTMMPLPSLPPRLPPAGSGFPRPTFIGPKPKPTSAQAAQPVRPPAPFRKPVSKPAFKFGPGDIPFD